MIGFISAFTELFFGVRSTGQRDQEVSDGPARSAKSAPTLLVIDDDRSFLDSVRALLRSEGYNVLIADSGTKGLDMLRYAVRDIRVVLLDYSMPRLDGAETLQYVRKLCPSVKVIAVTGIELDRVPSNFTKGVDCCIRKPFNSSQLLEAIRSMSPKPAEAVAA